MGDEAWNTSTGWRWMLGLEVVPAVAFIALLFLVPESPRWLVLRGREDEAEEILRKVDGPDHAVAELAAIRGAAQAEEGRFSELIDPTYFRPLLIAVVLMIGSQFCGINAIIYYSSKIFESAGAAKQDAFTSTVWMGFVNLIFTFVAVGLVDKVGRRPLFLIGTALQTVALGLIGWMFHTHHNGMALLVCIVTFTAAFAMSTGPLVWLLCSEIFPNKIRGRAMAVATVAIWAACYIVAQTFPMLNDSKAVGPALTFWIYAIVSLGSFVFISMFVPETKGRSLEEIEASWRQRK
jgi:SP family arabinose:H+ symporter-like MFS transporter